MKQPTSPRPGQRLAVCRTALGFPLTLMAVYAAAMMLSAVLGWQPGLWATGLWAGSQVLMGVGLFCLYRHQAVARWAAVGVVLVLAGVMSLVPMTPFLTYALQALGLAGLSLVFYDLEKHAGIPLMLPGGLLFLAVMASILATPLTALFGLGLLLAASLLALARM